MLLCKHLDIRSTLNKLDTIGAEEQTQEYYCTYEKAGKHTIIDLTLCIP